MNRKQRRAELAQSRKQFTIYLPEPATPESMAELRREARSLGIKRLRFEVNSDSAGAN